jgi:hypothetical protein
MMYIPIPGITPMQLAWFKRKWIELAERGQVDEWNGVECRRVLRRWAADHCPTDIVRFIGNNVGLPPI